MVVVQIKNNNVRSNVTCQYLLGSVFEKQKIPIFQEIILNLENFGTICVFFSGKKYILPIIDGDIIELYQNKVISENLNEIPGLENSSKNEYFGGAPMANSWYYIIFFIFLFIVSMLVIIGISFYFYKKKYGSVGCLLCGPTPAHTLASGLRPER